MPLVSGSSPQAFKQNVRTLMGEVGKSPHVQSRAQAQAIAYSKQRRGRAEGGEVVPLPIGPRPGGGLTPRQMEILMRQRTGTPLSPTPVVPFQRPEERAEGGIVDHDEDPDLPPVRDDARMIPMLPTPRGYQDPAYIQTIQRILEGQKRLNAMHPIQREMLRRYYLGGMLYHLGGYVY